MEQFKQYEKETKTKPYSKEALSRSQEVTEEDKSKEEIRSWIGSVFTHTKRLNVYQGNVLMN